MELEQVCHFNSWK